MGLSGLFTYVFYGTDLGAAQGMTDPQRIERKARIEQRNDHFTRYLATDDEFPFGDLLRGKYRFQNRPTA